MKPERWVKMRPLRDLVRARLIDLEFVSDDGQFMRYKILPNGPIVGRWVPLGKMLVVDCDTIHINEVDLCPKLFEDVE